MSMGRIVLASVLSAIVLAAGGVVVGMTNLGLTFGGYLSETHKAPDSGHIAQVISVREPGAQGRRYVVVRIAQRGPDGEIQGDSGVVWLENARLVSVQWPGPKRLVVQYSRTASVEGRVPRIGDVRINYLAVDSISVVPPLPSDTAHPRAGAARPRAAAK